MRRVNACCCCNLCRTSTRSQRVRVRYTNAPRVSQPVKQKNILRKTVTRNNMRRRRVCLLLFIRFVPGADGSLIGDDILMKPLLRFLLIARQAPRTTIKLGSQTFMTPRLFHFPPLSLGRTLHRTPFHRTPPSCTYLGDDGLPGATLV